MDKEKVIEIPNGKPEKKPEEQTTSRPAAAKKRRSRRSREEKSLKIFLLLITLAVTAAVGRNIYQRNYLFDENAKTLNKDSLYKDRVKEQLQGRAELSDFHFRVSGEGKFPEGTKKAGSLFIENPVDNPYRMQVTIKEKKTGEELYESPVLKPGKNVSGFKLNKALSKGNHEAAAYIKALEKTGKSNTELGEFTVDIYLEVE